MILLSLKLILTRYRSVRELYNAIKPFILIEKEKNERKKKREFSYSHFNRYITGKTPIPDEKEDIFIRFLHNNFNIGLGLVQPNIDIDIDAAPIHVDMSTLMSYPDKVNLLAFHIIREDHLRGKFDAILTHSEAIPLAIAFSQILEIPWFSVTFRAPPVHPSRISQHPYLIDQEMIATAYFLREPNLRNKRLLIISDYIRRGGFIDILFRVAEDNKAKVKFLLAIIGIGNAWNRFNEELEGNMRVVVFL